MLLTPTDPPTLPFGVWDHTNLEWCQLWFWNKPMLLTPPLIRRPYRSACGIIPILNDTNFDFETNQCCLHPSDMKTRKYNNLTNLTGMIWHIDPATKVLERNQFWKLAFRITASFKSRKWPIYLPEGSKGSIGDPTWSHRANYTLTSKCIKRLWINVHGRTAYPP